MKIIFDYNRTIFDPDTQELYSGAFELISVLSEKHELFLVSANEPGRKERLIKLGITDFFKKVVFTNDKSPELFREIIGEEKNVIVVGDRIWGEISAGNQLGYITVWIKQGKFSMEMPITKKQRPKHVINNISELKEIIDQYEK